MEQFPKERRKLNCEPAVHQEPTLPYQAGRGMVRPGRRLAAHSEGCLAPRCDHMDFAENQLAAVWPEEDPLLPGNVHASGDHTRIFHELC